MNKLMFADISQAGAGRSLEVEALVDCGCCRAIWLLQSNLNVTIDSLIGSLDHSILRPIVEE